MSESQREISRHIEFQLSLMRLVAAPQVYGSVSPKTHRPSMPQEVQFEKLIGESRKPLQDGR